MTSGTPSKMQVVSFWPPQSTKPINVNFIFYTNNVNINKTCKDSLCEARRDSTRRTKTENGHRTDQNTYQDNYELETVRNKVLGHIRVARLILI